MGFFGALKRWWVREIWDPGRFVVDTGPGSVADLRKRLGRENLRVLVLSAFTRFPRGLGTDDVHVWYQWRHLPKKGGGRRIVHSPISELKALQRLLLRKVFKKLKTHPRAMGFVRSK